MFKLSGLGCSEVFTVAFLLMQGNPNWKVNNYLCLKLRCIQSEIKWSLFIMPEKTVYPGHNIRKLVPSFLYIQDTLPELIFCFLMAAFPKQWNRIGIHISPHRTLYMSCWLPFLAQNFSLRFATPIALKWVMIKESVAYDILMKNNCLVDSNLPAMAIFCVHIQCKYIQMNFLCKQFHFWSNELSMSSNKERK